MQKHTKHNRHNNVLHFNASHMNLYWECKSSQGRRFCSSAKRSTLDIAGKCDNDFARDRVLHDDCQDILSGSAPISTKVSDFPGALWALLQDGRTLTIHSSLDLSLLVLTVTALSLLEAYDDIWWHVISQIMSMQYRCKYGCNAMAIRPLWHPKRNIRVCTTYQG